MTVTQHETRARRPTASLGRDQRLAAHRIAGQQPGPAPRGLKTDPGKLKGRMAPIVTLLCLVLFAANPGLATLDSVLLHRKLHAALR